MAPHRPRPAGAPKALDGIRVVDFTRVIAGPYCAQLLSDLGADIVKVEHPVGGDDTRQFQYGEVAGQSVAFLSLNRNKRSIALDLSVPEGRAVARALIERADVLLENFSTGVMDRHGLGYKEAIALNPRLIYCSISAYGREGEFAKQSGYDPITQAESGFMSMNGFPDGQPVRTGVPIIDMSSGMMACNAVLAGLLAREKIGKGQHVQVALFDQAVTMTGFYGPNFLVTGEEQKRFGNSPGGSATVGLFQADDGPFYVAASNDRLFRRLLLEVLKRPDIANDPEFSTPKARAANKVKLRQVMEGLFKGKTRDQWVSELKAANVPSGPLRTVAEAFVSPEIAARELVSGLPHPIAGTVPNIAPPLRLSETPIADPVAAPLLGQHTDEVLKELGYDAAKISALKSSGACGKQ